MAENELRGVVRTAGLTDLRAVRAEVLETKGTFSVMRQGSSGTWALEDVRGVEHIYR